MKNMQPIFDPTTHYQIELKGRVDEEWLQSFNSSLEISADASKQQEDATVLIVSTDQAGMIGLLRSLHGLGRRACSRARSCACHAE